MNEFLREILAYLKSSHAPPYVVIGVLSFGIIAWAMWKIGLASKEGVAAIRAQYKDNLEELERRHNRITDERDSCERRLRERDQRIGALEAEVDRLKARLNDTQGHGDE